MFLLRLAVFVWAFVAVTACTVLASNALQHGYLSLSAYVLAHGFAVAAGVLGYTAARVIHDDA
jgi:hypothetical protein